MKARAILIFLLVFISSAFSLDRQEVAGSEYLIRHGKSDELKVSGTSIKEAMPRVMQEKPTATPTPYQESVEIDTTKATILKVIKSSKSKKTATAQAEGTSLLSLPSTYKKDLEEYRKNLQIAQAQAQQSIDSQVSQKEVLFLAQCKTFKDYQINEKTNMKMLCRDKTGKEMQIFAELTIALNGEKAILEATPYMYEDEMGKMYPILPKSKLFNAVNGSSNLATYADKRALEKVSRAMAEEAASQIPVLSKEYLDKKNASQSEVSQNDTTTVTATTTPKPDAIDYAITLLFDMAGKGLSAGLNQIYQDLGYIYYIPRNSMVDAEIYYILDK